MFLRDYNERKEGDFLEDCFGSYLDKSTIPAQREKAQKLSIQYYDEALKLDPGNEWVRGTRKEVIEGIVSWWSYCGE